MVGAWASSLLFIVTALADITSFLRFMNIIRDLSAQIFQPLFNILAKPSGVKRYTLRSDFRSLCLPIITEIYIIYLLGYLSCYAIKFFSLLIIHLVTLHAC